MAGPVPFGKYFLLDRIAHGGMAEVFRAVWTGPAGVERTVALKRILPMHHGAAEFTAMFIDEARIAASLTHVNVAQVLEFGEVDGTFYLAMELIEGTDLGRLAEAARRRGLQLPPPLVAFAVAEAARGLAYAHDKRGPGGAPLGIVHRDVSPQNVLVSYAGEVKIADFGIAKAKSKLHKTESGAVMGKLRYMSPEQVMGEPLDGRSDLFSLGVVLYELLTGRTLFDGESPGRVAEQVKEARVPPPSSLQPEVPEALDRICLALLERSREARPARASDVARELQRLVSEKAPGLTREDLGALVSDLVPRRVEPEPLPDTGEAPNGATPEAFAPTIVHTPPALAHLPPALTHAPPELALTREARPPGARTATAGTAGRTSAGPTAEPETAPGQAARARRRGRGLAVGGALVVIAAGAGLIGYRSVAPRVEEVAPVVVDAGPIATVSVDAAAAPAPPGWPSAPEAVRASLLARLESLPQANVVRWGVRNEAYLALLSAVDATLCSSSTEPAFPPESMERLHAFRVEPEAAALARYVLTAGELPPAAASALSAFLGRGEESFAPGPPPRAFAGLAVRVQPERAASWLALLRQNSTLHRWHERAPEAPAPSGFAALCDRPTVIARYQALDPGPRARTLARYLAAGSLDTPLDAGGLRWVVLGAERDEAAATLDVRLRVTNPGVEARPLELGQAQLVSSAAPLGAPAIDPPADQLGPGLVRELRLRFSGVTDEVAEAAVLVLRPGAEVAVYSELVR